MFCGTLFNFSWTSEYLCVSCTVCYRCACCYFRHLYVIEQQWNKSNNRSSQIPVIAGYSSIPPWESSKLSVGIWTNNTPTDVQFPFCFANMAWNTVNTKWNNFSRKIWFMWYSQPVLYDERFYWSKLRCVSGLETVYVVAVLYFHAFVFINNESANFIGDNNCMENRIPQIQVYIERVKISEFKFDIGFSYTFNISRHFRTFFSKWGKMFS